MIRDYMLALLSAPMSTEDSTARFETGSVPLWHNNLVRWLHEARAMDHSLDFTVSNRGTRPGLLSLRIHRPLVANVTVALVTDPSAIPQTIEEDLLVVLFCCPQWLVDPQDDPDVLVLEPRWSAALLLDDATPLFWGVSAAEQAPSVLDAR
ncbi:hypothetical protein JOF56_007435 [Kibdelosporangium banguiense]|uniref:Uncharacterized protein n=1 Tax=Kibdelosporangium banguiense TaxID=1365924 RepID=A0ABS4TSW1_9PSEU|nr:hypothetical protein [Kibdelosporangium banguiense]MBP2327050.1 hypothetical protein [Kibdelosporangium banguiense]